MCPKSLPLAKISYRRAFLPVLEWWWYRITGSIYSTSLGESGDDAFLSSLTQALEQLGFRESATLSDKGTVMIRKLKQICDIYLTSSVGGDHGCLQGLNLFTAAGFIDGQTVYRGYLRVDLQRLHAVSAVTCLRQSNFISFSVPIEYRDSENIRHERASAIADDFLNDSDEQLAHSAATELCPPVFWAFRVRRKVFDPEVEERAGSKHIYIDRIDGRIWSYQEVLEYNYDYNNLL